MIFRSTNSSPTSSQAGISLVEILIALGIMSVVIAGITQLFTNTEKSSDRMAVLRERDKIARVIEKSLANPLTIKSAIPAAATSGNLEALRRCMNITGQLCTVTGASRQVPFSFVAQRGIVPLSIPETGAYFNRNGAPTTAGDSKAFWVANIWFYATCPGDTPTCKQARTISFRYQIKPYKNGLGWTPPLPAMPPDEPPAASFSLNPSLYALSHRVDGILGLAKNQLCPIYSEMVGYDRGGKFLCVCRFGFPRIGTDNNGQPICSGTDLMCTSTAGQQEVLTGVTKEGKPICTKARLRCEWVNFGANGANGTFTSGGSAYCRNGGWLEKIDLGTCRAQSAGKKSTGQRPIDCDRNRGYCCYNEIP